MKEIVLFNEVCKNDVSLAGGKGANLGEMTNNGFNVPEGFIITTEFYKEFINFNNLKEFINLEFAKNNDIKLVGEIIRKRFIESKIPNSLEEKIIKALEKFNDKTTFAVRSSATAEDLGFASFAGQQDTYLNIYKKDILHNIRKCFASLYNERAILYRTKNNLDNLDIEMAVVIQRMINADISGIMFTANPVNGDRNIISIDASYGLGEALVSGLVTPDIYYFNKRKNEIENMIISEKKVQIDFKENGGVSLIDIEEGKRNIRVLDNEKVENLATIGQKIEKHYNCPQDIEWCMENGQLYITQSRAITSLYPLVVSEPLDDKLHVYMSLNHWQVMLDPICPLGIDLLAFTLPIGSNNEEDDIFKYCKRAGGRIYIDITAVMQSKELSKIIFNFLRNVDQAMGDALDELSKRAGFLDLIFKDKNALKSLEFIKEKINKEASENLLYKDPEKQVKKMDETYNNIINNVKSVFNREANLENKFDMILELADVKKEMLEVFPILAAGIFAFKKLTAEEMSIFGNVKYTPRIVKGVQGNITSEMGLYIGDLADYIREDKILLEEFQNTDYKSLFYRINKLQGHGEFKEVFNNFMSIYDMRAAKEIDVRTERWSENPQGLVTSIMSIVKTGKKGSHREEYRQAIIDANEASKEFIEKIKKEKGIVKAKEIERLIKVCRTNMSRREHPKYMLMKIILEFKKVILEVGEKFKKEGRIENRDDIFYVRYFEIKEFLKNNLSLKELISKRKEKYERFEKLKPARVFTSTGEEVRKKENINTEDGVLKGVAASGGKVIGIAKVINDPNKEEIKKGEILIAPFTDPGWTPLFINSSALVMEIGGMLTHGTVVAREYGIPAVVGVKEAMEKIKTGDKIEVDGDNGIIKILK